MDRVEFNFEEKIPLRTIPSLVTAYKNMGYDKFDSRIYGSLCLCNFIHLNIVLDAYCTNGTSFAAHIKIIIHPNDGYIECAGFCLPKLYNNDTYTDPKSDIISIVKYAFKRAFESMGIHDPSYISNKEVVQLVKLACCIIGAKYISYYSNMSHEIFEKYVYPDLVDMIDGMFEIFPHHGVGKNDVPCSLLTRVADVCDYNVFGV